MPSNSDAEGGPKAAAAAPAAPEPTPAEIAAKLAELFPALFAAVPNTPPKPIKLRIQTDIQLRAPGLFTRRSLSPFLHRHTTTTSYLKALVSSAHRYDLDGAPAGEVSDEHRQAAQAELDRRWAIVQARRAAARAAQRPVAPEAAASNATDDAGPAPREARRPGRPAHDRRDPRRPAGARDDLRRPPDVRPERKPGPPARDRGPLRADRSVRADRPPRHRPDADSRAERGAPRQAPAEPVVALPDDPARRERALLLRAYESTTLSRANFCALKRIDPEQLDALLEQARNESRTNAPRGAPSR